jgi:hypothetical protein
VRISSDRITPAPTPLAARHTFVVQEVPQPVPGINADDSEGAKYVFEKIVGARRGTDGSLRYRIRWYGYSREEDTWEPATHLPSDAIRRYHRKTGIPYSH